MTTQSTRIKKRLLVEIPDNPEPLPEQFLSELLPLIPLANKHARSLLDEGIFNGKRFYTRREKYFTAEDERLKILQSACFYGIIADKYRENLKKLSLYERKHFYEIAAYTQRCFLKLGILLCKQDLQRVIHLGENLGLFEPHWIATVYGGFYVANVAHLFVNMGAKVYIPSVSEDMLYRTDLLVHCLNERYGLAVQVKGRKSYVENGYLIERDVVGTHKKEISQHDLDAIRLNNPGVDWIPLHITVQAHDFLTRGLVPTKTARKDFRISVYSLVPEFKPTS